MTLALKTSFSRMGLSLLALAGLGLASINSAQAQTTADPNILSGTTVTATNPYNASAFAPANLTNGGTTPFVFADNGASPESVSITGFDSAIDTLRFFDAPDFLYRTSASVIIGYSSTANAGLAGTYTYLNGGAPISIATSPGYDASPGNDYLNPTSPAQTQTGPASTGTHTIRYSDLTNLNIPAGTQSLIFTFTQPQPDPTFNNQLSGAAITQIQGFTATAAPEPAQTAALGVFVLGIAGLAFRRRCTQA